jgi:hypothetical protein
MKSWNGPDEHAPLIAPLRSPPAGDGVRVRALVLTVITCMGLFGLDALFPDVKGWSPPQWNSPARSGGHQKPFEWSQVCHKLFSTSLGSGGPHTWLVRLATL